MQVFGASAKWQLLQSPKFRSCQLLEQFHSGMKKVCSAVSVNVCLLLFAFICVGWKITIINLNYFIIYDCEVKIDLYLMIDFAVVTASAQRPPLVGLLPRPPVPSVSPHIYTVSGKKRGHVIFDYKSRISWWIFIIFIPLETGTNIPQSYIIYLLDGLMTS